MNLFKMEEQEENKKEEPKKAKVKGDPVCELE
jgi:hypothetical protein